MRIDEKTHGAVTVVRPVGPLTQADAEELKQRLMEVRDRSLGRMVLDASAMPFADSRGLEVLVEVNEAMIAGGWGLKACGLSEVLREVLVLTDLASSLEQFNDVNSAVRSFL
jgi:anti-anti-sigma factor